MGTRDLQSILLSGEVTGINMNGATQDDQVMTRGQIRDELSPAGIMLWKGAWASDFTYGENQVVRDGAWLMIANKTTQQKPAPVPVGTPKYSFNVAPTFTSQSDESTIYSGHKITFTKPGWVTQLLVNVPEIGDDINYRILVINNTNPAAPITDIIDDPVLIADGWAAVSLGQTLVGVGTEFIIVVDALNSGSAQLVTGGWTYNGTGNAAPLTGNWNTDNGEALLRIHKTDLDTTDRTSELLGMIPGSTIQFAETAQPANYKQFLTTAAPVDAGTHVEYTVIKNDEGGALVAPVTTTMTASIPIPQATAYQEEVDHWLTNGQPDFATLEGILEFDGVPQAGVENNAYGIALYFQEATASNDWDFLAYSELSGGGGGGGGGGGSYDFTKVSGVTIASDAYQEIARLVVSRSAGLYELKMSLTWTLNSTTTSGFMRWSTDGGVTWNEFQSEPKDITNKTAVFYAYPYNHDGGVFDYRFEARKEVAGDVMTIDFLDLIFESKP